MTAIVYWDMTWYHVVNSYHQLCLHYIIKWQA